MWSGTMTNILWLRHCIPLRFLTNTYHKILVTKFKLTRLSRFKFIKKTRAEYLQATSSSKIKNMFPYSYSWKWDVLPSHILISPFVWPKSFFLFCFYCFYFNTLCRNFLKMNIFFTSICCQKSIAISNKIKIEILTILK